MHTKNISISQKSEIVSEEFMFEQKNVLRRKRKRKTKTEVERLSTREREKSPTKKFSAYFILLAGSDCEMVSGL